MQKILLITGWGLGVQPLQSLQHALTQQGFDVQLIDIFNSFDPHIVQQHVQLAQKFDVIMGWSLGGQLAAQLCDQIYHETQDLKVLVTLASNPTFIAQPFWQVGMEQSMFMSFKHAFDKDPLTTLKRFCYLVTEGHHQAKQNWLKLQSFIDLNQIELNRHGLELLECLNVVEIVKNYTGQQLHLFALQDGLVNCKVIENMKKLSAQFLKIDSINGSHGFPVFQAELISGKITQYLKSL